MSAKVNESSLDLNKGQLTGFVSNHTELSDERLHHITSQTTLNLDQKCPLNISIE